MSLQDLDALDDLSDLGGEGEDGEDAQNDSALNAEIARELEFGSDEELPEEEDLAKEG